MAILVFGAPPAGVDLLTLRSDGPHYLGAATEQLIQIRWPLAGPNGWRGIEDVYYVGSFTYPAGRSFGADDINFAQGTVTELRFEIEGQLVLKYAAISISLEELNNWSDRWDEFQVFIRQGDDQITGGPLNDIVAGYSGADTLDGGYGGDLVDGGDGNDEIFGGDEFFGPGGKYDDTMLGGAGDDHLWDVGGQDIYRGGPGADLIEAGLGADNINGNQGDDHAFGGAGADLVFGGQGDDRLFGGDDADLVHGNLGHDTAQGQAGADTVRGGQGDDSLAGGAGDDWLSGDRGDDTLSGGEGADTFHVFGEAGVERVLDFSRAEGDRVLVLAGDTYTTAQAGGDVVVSLAGGAQMVLVGVQLSSLGDGWIGGG